MSVQGPSLGYTTKSSLQWMLFEIFALVEVRIYLWYFDSMLKFFNVHESNSVQAQLTKKSKSCHTALYIEKFHIGIYQMSNNSNNSFSY